MVAADKAADVGRDMDIGARADCQAELARLDIHRLAHRRHEGRAAELGHRQAEQQVVHRRVAADRHVDDVGGCAVHGLAQVVGQRVDGGDRGFAQFVGRRGWTAAWLTRLITSAPQATCGFSMARLASRRPLCRSIRKAATLVVPRSTARPRVALPGAATADQFVLPQARAQRPRIGAQHARELPQRLQIQAQVAGRQGAAKPLDIAGRVGQAGRLQPQVQAAHQRIAAAAVRVGAARHLGAHHGGQRARRDLDRAVRQGAQLAGALPFLAPGARLVDRERPRPARSARPCHRRPGPSRCRRCRGRRRRRRSARRCAARSGTGCPRPVR